MNEMDHGKRTRLLRIMRDMTQFELARAARLHPSRLSMIERNLVLPKPAEARRLNEVLGEEVFPVEVLK